MSYEYLIMQIQSCKMSLKRLTSRSLVCLSLLGWRSIPSFSTKEDLTKSSSPSIRKPVSCQTNSSPQGLPAFSTFASRAADSKGALESPIERVIAGIKQTQQFILKMSVDKHLSRLYLSTLQKFSTSLKKDKLLCTHL